ncbi:MAG TPA: GNAT family N-acetyltransferase [Myxococcales bacterium]|nr:GNAT family N-acetyltransferase [Myxococcales bacterium]HIN85541.1 GNAT family N-acetyltransferase [Myxococcales bacterium]
MRYCIWEMKQLSHQQLDALSSSINAAACVTPGVSTYCSGADWFIASSGELMPSNDFYLSEDSNHYVILTRDKHDQVGPYLRSLEVDWGFTSPLLGEDPRISIELLYHTLVELKGWNCVFLGGLSSDAMQLAGIMLSEEFQVESKEGTHCQVGSLSGGVDGFLGRRTSNFRSNLVRARRKAKLAGLQFDHFQADSDCADWYQRVQSIESKTWKSDQGKSIFSNPRYNAFYWKTMERAAHDERMRSVIATIDGVDVGYILGAVLGSSYRGFQIGYAQQVEELSVGNLCQIAQIETLCDEGITEYDLGMIMDYKSRWGETQLKLYHLMIYRR